MRSFSKGASGESENSRWIEQFVPRSDSKIVFLFAAHCYSLALTGVAAQFVWIAGFWKAQVDPATNASRYIRPGIDGANLWDLLLLSPIVESLIVVGVIELLRRCGSGVIFQLMAAISLICLLHGLDYGFWAFSIAPAFLVQTMTYLYWRRITVRTGLGMIVVLHLMYNSIPALILIVEGARGL